LTDDGRHRELETEQGSSITIYYSQVGGTGGESFDELPLWQGRGEEIGDIAAARDLTIVYTLH
jgi:hypothetical protein